jgi:putative membrane protein
MRTDKSFTFPAARYRIGRVCRASMFALFAAWVSLSSAATNDSAEKFLADALQDGRAEIQTCELALKSSHEAAVQAFAKRMIQDHQAMNDKIVALAKQKGYRLPDELTLTQRATYTALKPLSGHAFDSLFMKHNLSDHESDIKLFSDQAVHASDEDVRALAGDGLATLREHLQLAKQTDAALKK